MQLVSLVRRMQVFTTAALFSNPGRILNLEKNDKLLDNTGAAITTTPSITFLEKQATF